MSMYHKAYAFDWRAFEQDELFQILHDALKTGDPSGIVRYIETHRAMLKDPYEGERLADTWPGEFTNRDVHEYGDFALTRFYDPAADRGLAWHWANMEERLPTEQANALLGEWIFQDTDIFDPSRQGSYFQRPERVKRSLEHLRRCEVARFSEDEQWAMREFIRLLSECAANGLGLYVTF